MLHRVTLRNYRNVRDETLELSGGFTLLVGKNGAGKTNFLEAIYLLSTLRSFRTADTGGLIQHSESQASVAGEFADPLTDSAAVLRIELRNLGRATRKSIHLHGKLVRNAVQAYGQIRCVLFTPEDLSVLRGSPQGRRQLWDRLLFARERSHILDVQTYEKVLRSRNHVLKQVLAPAEMTRLLEVYESELAQVGARITVRRLEVLRQLRPLIQACFIEIHPNSRQIDLTYESPWLTRNHNKDQISSLSQAELAAELHIQLENSRSRDLLSGSTSVGPHRDDVCVTLDGHLVQDFASQGQTRAVMLAIKLAELRSLAEFAPAPTLLLLDDVSSEFDPERLAALYSSLAQLRGQCVITTTAAHHVHLPDGTTARWHHVSDGMLSPVSS